MMNLQFSGPRLSDAQLNEFEKNIGYHLPADYRSFLIDCNGGKPEFADFKQRIEGDEFVNCVVRFFPLLAQPNQDLHEEWQRALNELPHGFLPFGEDLGGEALCLCLNAQDYGSVHISDGYVEYLGRPARMIRLADSFADFLKSLFDKKAFVPKDEVYLIGSTGKAMDVTAYLARGGSLNNQSLFGANLAATAAAHGNIPVLQACMKLGANINGALTIAVLNGEWETMRFLVEAGADVNEVYPEIGKRPIQSVCAVFGQERERIIAYLKSHGATD